MSILYRDEIELPLLELAQKWAEELPDTSRNDVILALMQVGRDGLLDTVDEGRPGLYRDVKGRRERLDSQWLRGELAGPRHQLAVPERLAKSIVVTKAAVFAFGAARPSVPIPSFWAPEPASAHGVAADPAPSLDRAAADALLEDFMANYANVHGKTASRDTLREFARDNALPPTWADEFKRDRFPGKRGRPTAPNKSAS